MDDLERELRQALRRKQPPAGFSARVLARTRRPWRWVPAAAAAAILLTVAGVQFYEYREGQRAKNQVLQAFAIAGDKFAIIERTLQHE